MIKDLTHPRNRGKRLFLGIVTAILLGIAYPPIPTGVTVFVAFIPFLLLLEDIQTYGETVRYGYFTLFIWHVIDGYWSGGFTHARDIFLMIGGSSLLLLNPFFYLLALLAFQLYRKQFGLNAAVLVFPFFWISIELLRANTQLALPWITLGNTQTYDLPVIQFASITGVYGISFWILIINVTLFLLYKKLILGEWKFLSPKPMFVLLFVLLVYLIPVIYGNIVLKESEQPTHYPKVKIALIQPNIDPFQKWEGNQYDPYDMQREMTRSLAGNPVDLVIWSETAIPFYLLQPNYSYYLYSLKEQIDSQHINLLSGVPLITYTNKMGHAGGMNSNENEPVSSESFNGSMLLQHNSDSIQTYAKMLLVPFAERVPYSEELGFLNILKWNVGLGGWGIGNEKKIFHFRTNQGVEASFSNMICFESIFPGFVSEFVRKGANFLTIITMDSWWGKTSGPYQHKQYAVLRAVENRRWIARCATGGVSCFIDPFGHILQSSELFTSQIVVGDIELRDDITFYSRHGDWFAELCLLFAGMFTVSACGKKFYSYIRLQQGNTNELY